MKTLAEYRAQQEQLAERIQRWEQGGRDPVEERAIYEAQEELAREIDAEIEALKALD